MKKIDRLIFLFGASTPIILRLIFPNFYHHDDVAAFVGWGDFATNFKDLYNTKCYCNYPVLGLLASTGIVRLFNNNVSAFLYAITIFDFLNVVLIYYILKQLNIGRAALWAGIIGLLPSTWAGGSLWGQIDNVGQCIILLSIFFSFHFNKKKSLNTNQFSLYLAIMGVLFSLALLTKQLLLFSLMPLSFLVLANILHQTRFKPISTIKYILICTFFTLLPVILFDIWLSLPDQYYFSHLERVFLTGSDHMDKISGNGFNIWILLDRDQWSSSTIPFYKNFSPKGVGIFLFLTSLLMITIFLIRNLKSKWAKKFDVDIIVSFIFYLALTNLAFNIFLSGTHERYLYHFYPFIIIALLATRKYFSVALCILGAGIYGIYVLSVMPPTNFEIGHQFVLLTHSILFFHLLYVFWNLGKVSLTDLD